jgi:hypothetical protein
MNVATEIFKITKIAAVKGASQITWNVDKNGRPYGQIWTFNRQKGFRFHYTAKLLSGQVEFFNTYKEAENFIRSF